MPAAIPTGACPGPILEPTSFGGLDVTRTITTAEEAKFIERLSWSHQTFVRQVIAIARGLGWKTACFRPGKTNRLDKNGKPIWVTPLQGDAEGWPDLVLFRGKQKLAWELKVKRDKPKAAQLRWLDVLEAAGFEVAVCYPRHWDTMMAILERVA